ncbi:unnamed protein product [Oikopleura dioica]|uniref:Helicase ATP-binding domain-containing protein n=1 Tax=Oikopleura dioica TaxID=34765 RepID=E4XG58_OIKDI|nr:unnamed protein product [Oikopleura dioica]
MKAIYTAIEDRKIGIFESPTGTGKSLSIICSAIKWLKDHRNRAQLVTQQPKVDKEEDGELDWLDLDSDYDDDDGEGQEFVEKIFYASRTHSQLSQFVKEIRKSPFKDSVTVAPIASRATLCVNPKVKKLSTVSQMNESCKQLNKNQGCEFKTKKGLSLLSHRMNNTLMDIEDTVKFGNENKCCPFYGAREALPTVDVCVLPYNLLVVPSARESCGINLKNSVVIIDEAHNLAGAIESCYSVGVTLNALTEAYKQLNAYKAKFSARLNPENLMFVKQLLAVLIGLGKDLKRVNNSEQKIVTVREILNDAKLDNINLFELLKYMTKSLIAHKVKGFADKVANTPKVIVKPKENALKEMLTKNVLITPGADLRIIKNANDGKAQMKVFLLNPASIFAEISKDARSVLLAGGTMKPYQTLKDQLFAEVSSEKLSWFNCEHVISDSQMNALVLQRGPTNERFIFNHSNKDNFAMKQDLGRALVDIVQTVPSGVVVFFASYKQETMFYEMFKKSGFLQQIENVKTLFREPKETAGVAPLLEKYEMSVRVRGAILFAVVGGKVSEGINFSDGLCRAVIMIGVPYPDIKSAEIKLRMDTLNSKRPGGGQMLYTGLCMRAVNQCVGRAIRHRDDSSLILFCDGRYSEPRVRDHLPDWIKTRLTSYDNFDTAKKHMIDFCKKNNY